MLKQIDKRGKLLVKIQCDTCRWTKWLKPKQVPKYHNCPQCIQNLNKVLMTPQETPKALEETQEVPFEIIEDIDVKPVDPQADTEKIIKKSPKKHK